MRACCQCHQSTLREMLPLPALPRPDRPPPQHLAHRLRELLGALSATAATIAAGNLTSTPAHRSRAAAACVVFAVEPAVTRPAEVGSAETPAAPASRIVALCLDQVAALTPMVRGAVRAATEAACAVETEILRSVLAAEGPAGRPAD
ncbi:unnamed protein product [Pedinophyceae sp. YPF-701]|nr:unnamed protein product [Pedinophyceae sp. YPF-701]